MPVITSMEELAEAQQADKQLKTHLDENTSLNLLKFILSGFSLPLYCDCSTDTIRPFVLKVLRRKIIKTVHTLHPGKVTSRQINQKFVWPSMDKEIKSWSRSRLPSC